MSRSRLLTLDRLRELNACPRGLSSFKYAFGKLTYVTEDPEWYLNAAPHFLAADVIWVSFRLLTHRDQLHVRDLMYVKFYSPNELKRTRVGLAAFAVLYVRSVP